MDEVKALIAKIVSVVLKTPTACFEISGDGVFSFYHYNGENIYYIERDGDKYWSQWSTADVDNLQYLLDHIGDFTHEHD